jgi:hypothetical protein
MNVLLALVLYNTCISSFNQVEPFYEELDESALAGKEATSSESEGDTEEAKQSKKVEQEGTGGAEGDDGAEPLQSADGGKQGSLELDREAKCATSAERRTGPLPTDAKRFRIADLQSDLFNLVQLVHLEPSELQKAPPGSAFPPKLPVSSVLLSFQYLLQSPLPLALSGKRAQQARERAEQLRGQQRPTTSRSRVERGAKAEATRAGEPVAASKRDI